MRLLLDFGASRAKAAAFDPGRNKVLAMMDVPAPEPEFGPHGEVETSPLAYCQLVRELHARLTVETGANFESAWLCTEMHGFVLVDAKTSAPASRYISWRDARATVAEGDGRSSFDELGEQYGAQFRDRTGMRLRPGLPFVTLNHLARRGAIARGLRLLSLAEWIAVGAGRGSHLVHETLAAASGFYDIKERAWSGALFDAAGGRAMPEVAVNRVVDDCAEPIGELDLGGRFAPLFAGVGDMQAAVFGVGPAKRSEACVNLGTGSQVAIVEGAAQPPPVEVRPFFAGQRLSALTHIPSGRALLVLADFVDAVAEASGGSRGLFWRLLSETRAEQALESSLSVDLNLFPAAWKYGDGGALMRLHEGAFSPAALAAGVVRSYAAQYAEALALLDPDGAVHELILAGGVARRIACLPDVLARVCGRRVRFSPSEEEALNGLALLSQGSL